MSDGEIEQSSSRLRDGSATGDLAADFLGTMLRGERSRAVSMIVDAVEGGLSIRDAYLGVFQPVQREVGELWMENRISVAQEHFCTAVTQLTMSQLYPKLFGGPRNGRSFVAAVIGGDLHEVGLRMVSDFFEMAGWDTYFMGANTPAEAIYAAVQDRHAHLLGLSVTIAEHLPELEATIGDLRDLREEGLRVMVGGWPFLDDPDLVKGVGADGWAPDAAEAPQAGERLVGLAS